MKAVFLSCYLCSLPGRGLYEFYVHVEKCQYQHEQEKRQFPAYELAVTFLKQCYGKVVCRIYYR